MIKPITFIDSQHYYKKQVNFTGKNNFDIIGKKALENGGKFKITKNMAKTLSKDVLFYNSLKMNMTNKKLSSDFLKSLQALAKKMGLLNKTEITHYTPEHIPYYINFAQDNITNLDLKTSQIDENINKILTNDGNVKIGNENINFSKIVLIDNFDFGYESSEVVDFFQDIIEKFAENIATNTTKLSGGNK